MQPAIKPSNEKERIAALLKYRVLDTEAEKSLDQITALASEICGVPISLVSLVDSDRQWFKSKFGLDAQETHRNLAFCAHAILEDDIFEVPDATKDKRFFDNPLVTSEPDIRFYAGAPLTTPDGQNIGTLCVIDKQPKELTDHQKHLLSVLADQVIYQLELKSRNSELEALIKQRESMYATLSHDLKSPFNAILNLSIIIEKEAKLLNSSKLEKYSGMLRASAHSHYQWLNDLLQWSKFQLGEEPVLHKISLHSIFSELKDDYHTLLEPKKINLDLSLEKDIFVISEENMLKSILRNLVNNSIKFSPSGATITIKAGKTFEKNETEGVGVDSPSLANSVLIEVIDQGPGIPDQIADKLFYEFVTSQTGSDGELGTGIGLTLCGSMVNKMKGKIWVEDCLEGAHIKLRLAAG